MVTPAKDPVKATLRRGASGLKPGTGSLASCHWVVPGQGDMAGAQGRVGSMGALGPGLRLGINTVGLLPRTMEGRGRDREELQ